MIASENGKELVVQHLLLRGANVNAVTKVTNITNFLFHNPHCFFFKWNQSALLFATWGNYVKILEMLICSHADVNITTNVSHVLCMCTPQICHCNLHDRFKCFMHFCLHFTSYAASFQTTQCHTSNQVIMLYLHALICM